MLCIKPILRCMHWIILFVLMLGVSACATTSRTLDPATGLFPTGTKLSAEAVKEQKPFVEKYKTLLYVKTESRSKQYNDLFVELLKNMNVFDQVVIKQELEALVVERKLADRVSNISDLVGLNQLEKHMGPFLIVEPYLEWTGRHHFFASLKAIDPESGQTVLVLEQSAFDWAGLDRPLFYPLMNGFLQWTQGKPIAKPAE